MHPLNRFRDGYDFPRLVAAHPPLARFVIRSPRDEETIDFADPVAVLTLNQALLKDAYGLQWSLPPGALCPPIPGRLDYIHHLAALLGGGDAADVPRGRDIAILDLCAGANCILPLLGAAEYGWRYVATEADQSSHRWARQIVRLNQPVADLIEGRHQPDVRACFAHVTTATEHFAACSCNPPFHASHEDAAAGSARKRRNLKLGRTAATLNFGGSANELVCEGGEVGFIQRMIAESATRPWLCVWFTVMVSKSVNLPVLKRALAQTPATIVRTIDMAQGQKKSRLLAWTFVHV